MPDVKYANEQLARYLVKDKREFGDYSHLIEYILKDETPIHAKYNLVCLLMNYGTEKIAIDNLTRCFRTLYSTDADIDAYLSDKIYFNPKLGYIEISATHSISQSISLPVNHDKDIDVYFQNANKIISKVKEILTMMMIESRNVPIEKVNTEKSEP